MRPADATRPVTAEELPRPYAATAAAPGESSMRIRSSTARVRGRRFVARYALPLEWWLMGPAMLVAVLVHGWASWSLPPVDSGLIAMAAALLAVLAPAVLRG